MKRLLFFCSVLLCLSSNLLADTVESAMRNGIAAQEALVRSRRVLQAYLDRLDPVTGLLPRTGREKSWYVRDSAADLYPFLVMAAYFTDRPAFEKQMHEILRSEIRYSTRLGMLSDNVLPGGGGFVDREINIDRLIFGSCEYAKDGLLPLAELLGHSPWFERMLGLVEDMIAYAPYTSRAGRLPSLSAEVNGEFLQVLSRLAYLSGDPRYVDQAMRIGEFYFNEVIPASNGIPAHVWDLSTGRPADPQVFHLNDHGNEIVGGLAEFVLYLKESGHPAFTRFSKPLSDLVDLLLDCGLNRDGVWYTSITLDREPLDSRHAHCWGYLFNAVYTTYLVTGEQRFLDAVNRALKAVTDKPTYLDDPEGSGRNYGSNAYSDAIESAITFLSRLPDDRMFEVLDECVSRFLARQREDGIIEDWYGDGNYVRTALMYALMKTQGVWLEPWREDLRLGAVADSEGVMIAVESAEPWSGRLHFDYPRHKSHFNMPVNYPRLNEFPEWFVVDQDRLYSVRIGEEAARVVLGAELVRGFEVNLGEDDILVIRVSAWEEPPYGEK